MWLPFSRERRRQKILSGEFPATWLESIERNVWQYRRLGAAEQEAMRRGVRILLAEKHWEGCGGLEMTDEIRVTVAANACLLILGHRDFYYEGLETILVYPGGFLGRRDRFGRQAVLLGEAHGEGPVIVSWWFESAGRAHLARVSAVVLHEFAHILDMLGGDLDGIPGSATREQRRRWRRVLDREVARVVDFEARGGETLLSYYDLHDDVELFAFSTECFFLYPRRLRREHSRIYEALAGWYRQDPATSSGDVPFHPDEVFNA